MENYIFIFATQIQTVQAENQDAKIQKIKKGNTKIGSNMRKGWMEIEAVEVGDVDRGTPGAQGDSKSVFFVHPGGQVWWFPPIWVSDLVAPE